MTKGEKLLTKLLQDHFSEQSGGLMWRYIEDANFSKIDPDLNNKLVAWRSASYKKKNKK